MRAFVLICSVLLFSASAPAAPREARIPLRDGKIKLGELSSEMLATLHIKSLKLPTHGEIDVRGLRGSLMVMAMNEALGDGCRLSVNDDAIVLHFDADQLPHDVDGAKKATRVFTAVAAPEATADQLRTYGLLMPEHVEPTTKMVVLAHGLDCNRSNWSAMAKLLVAQGYQVAYFAYPSDAPLTENAALMARHLRALHEKYPQMPTSIVAYSMGGLVSRACIEGDDYAGGIDHLILIGTPNQGSNWATYRIALEIREHFELWRHEPKWRPSWMITDGLGEAARDLKPRSAFLTTLNARPRRADVRYTIIEGSQHPVRRISANAADSLSHVIPNRAASLWGFRQTRNGLHNLAEKWRHKSGGSDGPVSLASTNLEGVDDHVILQADHEALCRPIDSPEPAAWEIVRDRLAR